MYFESRSHQSVEVANAAEAVRGIHSGTISSYQVPIWKNSKGQRLALVADGHIDHIWQEVAMLNLDTKQQIESLTFGWIRTESLKIAAVQAAEIGQFVMCEGFTLSLDGYGMWNNASFECGCCGARFKSTIEDQSRFDQDAGYGICPACLARYPKEWAA